MENHWSDVDLRLTAYGGIFLGVAGICFGLPPISAIVIASVVLVTLACAHDKQAKRSLRNVSRESMRGNFTGSEAIKHIALEKQFVIDNPKRDYVLFTLGYWILMVSIGFKFIHLWLICNGGELLVSNGFELPNWLIKSLFGTV